MNSVPLNYKVFGHGPPVLVIHGLLGMLDNWKSIAKVLASDFSVYLVDLRNHGRSPHSDNFSYPDIREDLKQFVFDHDIVPTHVIGHSLGGKAVMDLALHLPELVNRLIVIDIAPRAYAVQHEKTFESLINLEIDKLTSRTEARNNLLARDLPSSEVDFLLKNLKRTPTGEFSWKPNLTALEENYTELVQAIEADGDQSFHGKSIFYRGENSNYVLENDLPTIQALFPESKVVTVPGAGHWVHVDAPDFLIRDIRNFLLEA